VVVALTVVAVVATVRTTRRRRGRRRGGRRVVATVVLALPLALALVAGVARRGRLAGADGVAVLEVCRDGILRRGDRAVRILLRVRVVTHRHLAVLVLRGTDARPGEPDPRQRGSNDQ